MTSEQKIADALRMVAMKLEHAIETGRRSKRLDANDLLETLLALADQIDPPLAEPAQDEPETT